MSSARKAPELENGEDGLQTADDEIIVAGDEGEILEDG